MTIWHDTPDAPRAPRRVSPGQEIELAVGTWPIQTAQCVWIEWAACHAQHEAHGTAAAERRVNAGVNSYWVARIGPFSAGTDVTYTVRGAQDGETVATPPFAVRVRPLLYVAWLWHQHQPLYRDPSVATGSGSYLYPWVRLHALRDYYSMAALAAEHDVHVTINLTPVLLRQIDDYAHDGATDGALELTRRRAEDLTPSEIDQVLSTFFDADWHHQIHVHRRYRELFDRRTRGGRFSRQDVRDLQMWFNLAWFGHEFRTRDVPLVTGDTVHAHRFVAQERDFTHDDVLAMVDDQFKILRAVIPVHRTLQDAGRIEVSTTPAFHPILPLLIDTDRAAMDRPGAARPSRYAWPDDAAAHVDLACAEHSVRFGRPPSGMWPAEGAVSVEAVDIIESRGIEWLATDAGVLARSGQWGYRTDDPDVLCRPYRGAEGASAVALFFRDTDLSDGVGFRYGGYANAESAVDEFVRTLETRVLERIHDDADRVLTIALDGENAWGGYADDGRPFLRALYSRLTQDRRFQTVTFSEYLHGHAQRGIHAHPLDTLAPVHQLATGSWIDEPGSAPGVDLGTWIGEPEENTAWNLLGMARAAYETARDTSAAASRAYELLLAAEGSDWFWWFGSDQESRNDASFDELFRRHLRGVYLALGLGVPDTLDDSIVPHPVVWTFAHPVSSIRPADRITIRTNCPGRLAYAVDGARDVVVDMAPVGGVMAGARRFQVTLGPFVPNSRGLAFRFRCEHRACQGQSPCCAGELQRIAIGMRPARAGAGTRARPSR